MIPALVVLLLLGGSDLDGAAEELRRAAAAALGNDITVVVRQEAHALSAAELIALEHDLGADAILAIGVRHGPRLEVSIRAHSSGSGLWTGRTVSFGRYERPNEIARAVGFAAATMLPDRVQRLVTTAPRPRGAAHPPAITVAPPDEGRPPPVASPGPPSVRLSAAEPSRHGPAATVPETPGGPAHVVDRAPLAYSASTRAGPERLRCLSMEVAGLLGLPADGVGRAFGGSARLGRCVHGRLRATAVASARVAELVTAPASAAFLSGGVGLGADVLTWRQLALGARAEMLVLRQSAARPREIYDDRGAARESRWLAATAFAADATVWLSPTVAVGAALGAELAWGRTDIYVDGVRRGAIGRLTPVLESSLRVRF